MVVCDAAARPVRNKRLLFVLASRYSSPNWHPTRDAVATMLLVFVAVVAPKVVRLVSNVADLLDDGDDEADW